MSFLSRLWSRRPAATQLADVLISDTVALATAPPVTTRPVCDVLRSYNWSNQHREAMEAEQDSVADEPAPLLATQTVRAGLQGINWGNRRSRSAKSGERRTTMASQATINTVDDVINQFAWD